MTPAGSDRRSYGHRAGAAIAVLTFRHRLRSKPGATTAYRTDDSGRCLALAATASPSGLPPPVSCGLIVVLAVGLRCFLLTLEPLLSTDIYRYVWAGRVQAAGINPYRYVPDASALASLRDAAIYPHINRADSAVTVYPPVAQMFFFVVTRLGETVTTMRLAFLACEAVTVAMIWMLLRQTGRPLTRTVAYLWHPLPMWEIANSGHIDALMIALMMTGLWLVIRRMTLRGVAAISLAALAKPFAILRRPAGVPGIGARRRLRSRSQQPVTRLICRSERACLISGRLPQRRRHSRRWRQLALERVASGVRRPSRGRNHLPCAGGTHIGDSRLSPIVPANPDGTYHSCRYVQALAGFPAAVVAALPLVFSGAHAICGAAGRRYAVGGLDRRPAVAGRGRFR